ncbi:MAG: hypothetical protein WB783_20435 [Arenicellales bacterium]
MNGSYSGDVSQEEIQKAQRLFEAGHDARSLMNGIDPGLQAAQDCDHAVRNASGAPWTVGTARAECRRQAQKLGQGSERIQGAVSKCWGNAQRALSLLETANKLYEQARQSLEPREGQLIKQAQQEHRQANEALDENRSCFDRAFELAAKVGREILEEVESKRSEGRPPGDAGTREPGASASGGAGQQGEGAHGGAKGIVRSDCNDAAAKGIVREDCNGAGSTVRPTNPTAQPPEPSETVARLLQGIDTCLRRSGLTYYRSPASQAQGGGVGYDPGSARVRYDPAFLDRQAPYVRAFWLADAFAAHVLNLERQQFGVRRSQSNALRARDYLAGYIAHCLTMKNVLPQTGNLSPDDPRIQYRSYLSNGGFSLPGDPWRDGSDIEDWDRGWREYGMGVIFSLRHDPSLPPTRSDPYLP